MLGCGRGCAVRRGRRAGGRVELKLTGGQKAREGPGQGKGRYMVLFLKNANNNNSIMKTDGRLDLVDAAE